MERRKKANTPLEQIFYNTQDIKQLEEAIAPFYNCSIDLSNDSVSVAVSNTNLPTDITKAYITDYNGNVYKFIAFNDDKTTAYIEYYASLKGADGRDAVDDIDDTTTANNKLWSSQKTSDEITNATKIKVVYTTTDTPTTSGSDYIFDKNNITPAIIDASIIGKELYQIVDDKIKYAYRVNTILNDDVYTSLVGEFGGGKALYEHNVYLKIYDTNDAKNYIECWFTFNSDNNEEINTQAKFEALVLDKIGAHNDRSIENGFISANGWAHNNGNEDISGITMGNYASAWTNITIWFAYNYQNNITYANFNINTRFILTIKDNVKEL